MEKVNVGEKFDLFSDCWSPKIAAEFNDSYIKLAKLKAEFVWHHHEKEDELFFVMKGWLLIKLRDGEVRIGPGEFVVIPRGVDHLPLAEDEVHVILIEPKTTLNTGNVVGDKTVAHLEKNMKMRGGGRIFRQVKSRHWPRGSRDAVAGPFS